MYRIIGADGREYGPVTLAQLRQWQSEGRVNAQTRLLAVGETNWKTLADLTEPIPSAAGTSIPQSIRPLVNQDATWRPQRTNGFAVTGLIFGIFSLLTACCCSGLPFNLLGVIFSAIALAQISRQPGVYSGKGVALAGLIVSIVSLLLGIGFMVLSLVLNPEEILRGMENHV